MRRNKKAVEAVYRIYDEIFALLEKFKGTLEKAGLVYAADNVERLQNTLTAIVQDVTDE